jgi:hypothetical protein
MFSVPLQVLAEQTIPVIFGACAATFIEFLRAVRRSLTVLRPTGRSLNSTLPMLEDEVITLCESGFAADILPVLIASNAKLSKSGSFFIVGYY